MSDHDHEAREALTEAITEALANAETTAPNMITPADAAALCGMKITTFRKAVSRHQALRDAREVYTPTFSLFDEVKIIEWNRTRRRYAKRD